MSERAPLPRRTIVVLLSVMVALSGLDLFLSWRLIGADGQYLFEINPIASWWLERFGWVGMAAFKFSVTLLVVGLIAIIVWRRPRTGELVLVFAIGAQSAVVAYSVFLFRFFEQLGGEPVVAAATTNVPGGPPPSPFSRGRTNGFLALLSDATVRDELNLPGEVRQSIDHVLRSAPMRGRGLPRSPGDMAAFQEHSRREAEVLSALSSEQTSRLQQIAWQQRGAFALADQEVATALELTETQRQEIRQVIDDYRRRSFGRRRGQEASGDDTAQKTDEQLWQVVTEPQRLAWQRLIGEPFQGSLTAEVTREVRQSGFGFGPRSFRPR
jgi:hypothetical protein